MRAAAKSFRTLCPALTLGFLVFMGSGSAYGDTRESLLGRKAPDWNGAVWVDSPAVQLPQLAGKVVLIRWWTAPGCPYCRATAPALNEFHQQYREQGLEVFGFYHHKSPEPLTLDAVREHARRFNFKFPIAIDPEWRTLNRWWLAAGGEKWTSVTFLLDRKGVVRHIHPGGQYVKGDQDYDVMKAKIEELLAEK
jgi:thiol-disulfide isomerase/thioredoxin